MSEKPLILESRISVEAFHALNSYTLDFAGQVRDAAVELARQKDPRNVITSGMLREAVVLACERMSSKMGMVESPRKGNTDGNPATAA